MFINNTSEIIFDEFSHKYEFRIYAKYYHLRDTNIHFIYSEQYLRLEKVPFIESLDNDPFAFSCCRNKYNNNVEAYIIYSPFNCKLYNLNNDEINAAISHEVGHIVHYFNETLNGKPNIIHEIKADEVVAYLGLSLPLSNLLTKLIASNKFTDYQEQSMKKRIMLL